MEAQEDQNSPLRRSAGWVQAGAGFRTSQRSFLQIFISRNFGDVEADLCRLAAVVCRLEGWP